MVQRHTVIAGARLEVDEVEVQIDVYVAVDFGDAV
jgi:uncharacterized alkaline shock family protein YloU